MRAPGWLARLGLLLLAAGAPPPPGDWTGSYVCAQGPTGLTLRLVPEPDGSLRAVFYFYASAENPGVPEGCFAMGGAWDAAEDAFDLHAGPWLAQPPGFVSVDLSGHVAGDVMQGQVLGPGCSTFSLRAIGGFSGMPAACHPSGGMGHRPPPPRPAAPHAPDAPPPFHGGGLM